MSTTPHPIAPEEIMAHLDGELSPAHTQSVSAHIETCASCQELATSLRSTSKSLANWTAARAPVSAKFADQLSAGAVNVSERLRVSSGRKTRIFPGQRWKLLTSSAVLAVLLILIIGSMGGRYNMTGSEARLAVAKHVAEQEALESSLRAKAKDQNYVQNYEMSSLQSGSGGGSGGGFAPSQAALDQKADLVEGPMIARTVTLALLVKDFDSARASLNSILARHHGYAATLGLSTPQGAARSLQASLRIPAPELASALIELKSLGPVETEMQNGEEVTRQHADLVARLKNSRETEQRLQAILTQRTGKISDVLEVEQEIARVRGEIERMEAEQKKLERRVDFVTIDLNLSEEFKAQLEPPAPAISTLIHNALVTGYRNVAGTLLALAIFFAEYGPVLFFWLLLFSIPAWLVWRRWRRAAAFYSPV